MTKQDREELQLHIKHMHLAETQTFWLGWFIAALLVVVTLIEVCR